ncbi:MAG: glycosyltransferase family 39 protein [Vicinamibacterales bacterium]
MDPTHTREAPSWMVTIATALAVMGLSWLLYGRDLDLAPVYLTKDEANFGLQSHEVAKTGRDRNGNFLPLFFQEPGFSIGRDPIYIYATALVLQFRPLDERSLRLPSAAAGVLAIGLTVLAAKELFLSIRLAALAAILVAVTPAFFIRSRAALSVIFPVAFELLWFAFLLAYLRNGRLSNLLGSTLALGVGVYSYLSMVFFAPVHFAVTIAALVTRQRWRHLAWATGCLALTLIPLTAWQLSHPQRIAELVGTYKVYEPHLNVFQGARSLFTWFSLGTRADVYWQAFNPSRLFFSGESSLIDSTRSAGEFPLAYMLLLPVGLYALTRRPLTIPHGAVLLGFLTAPIPGVIIGEDTIGRYLMIGPWAAFIAVAGVRLLWESRTLLARGLAVACVASTLILFRGFYVDYMGDWRIRSSAYLGGNLRGAFESVLLTPRSAAPDFVFISETIPYVDVFWEFYRRAHGRDDLEVRTRGLSLRNTDWERPPGKAVAIIPASEDAAIEKLKLAGWTVASEIHEFYGGKPSFVVLSRAAD